MAVETDLPEAVLQRTVERKLAWEVLSSGGYIARIGNRSIVIDRTGAAVALRVANDEGLVVERFSSRDRNDSVLENLYEQARRQALKVDETLSSVMRDLNSL